MMHIHSQIIEIEKLTFWDSLLMRLIFLLLACLLGIQEHFKCILYTALIDFIIYKISLFFDGTKLGKTTQLFLF